MINRRLKIVRFFILSAIFLFICSCVKSVSEAATAQRSFMQSRVITTDSSYSTSSEIDVTIDLNGGTATWFNNSSYADCWNGPYIFLYDDSKTSLSDYNLTTLWGYNTDINVLKYGGGRGVHFRTAGTRYNFKQIIEGEWKYYWATANQLSKITGTSVSGSNITIKYSFDVQGATPYLILPQVTKAGYEFTGWTVKTESNWYAYEYDETTGKERCRYTDKVGTVSTYPIKDASGKTWYLLDMGQYCSYDTVTANFKASDYTVKYNGNGATSGSTVNSIHSIGVAKNLTTNGFTRTGYRFAGWSTRATGAVAYSNGQSVTNLTTTGGTIVNLYAKWTPNTYTVVYNGNGATGGSTANSAHTYDVAKNLTANGFTRTGYTFMGWSTSANGSIAYSNQKSVKNLTTTHGGKITLYAKWEDKTVPAATISVKPSSWGYQSIVTVSGSDLGSGVAKIEIYRIGKSSDVNVKSQSYSALKQASLSFTHTYEGVYQYYSVVYDMKGNKYKTSVATVYVDRTKPVIDVINIPDEWVTRGSFVIDADISDVLSGIRSQSITVDELAVLKGHRLTEDGIYNVKFDATDKAGNANNVTMQVKIDSTPPEIKADIPEGWITDMTYTFHVDVTDNLSGVKEYKIMCAGEELSNDYVITENGNYVFTIIAYDVAGNMAVKSYRIKMDHTPPLIQDNDSNIKSGRIDYIATDEHSGLASFKLYDFDGNEHAAYDTVTGILNYMSFYTYKTEFYLEAYDNAGNVSTLKVETPYNFTMKAELFGERSYKDEFIGYKVGDELTLNIKTYGYVDTVEVIFTPKLNREALKEGYDMDRSLANDLHFILKPVKEEDEFQYVFKLPEMKEFAETVKRLKEDYTVKIIGYRNGYKKGEVLDLPVVNGAYIKSQIMKHFYTIIIE